MKCFFKLITFFSCLLFFTGYSEASCTYRALNTVNMSFGNITVQRDAPIGQSFATTTATVPYQLVGYCSNGGYAYDQFNYLGATPTSYSGVYATNISGVGLKLSPYTSSVYTTYYAGNNNFYSTGTYTMQLVKTGPIASGTLQTGMVAHVWMDDGRDILQFYLSGTNKVTQVACSITTSNVNVPLDPVQAGSFTSINSTKGDKPFTIGLSCDAGARINASLSFTQNAETSNNSVIQLTGAGTQGVATGVGIQLLYGSTVLTNNNNVVLKTSSGGQEFPAGAFTARYFQTKSTVTTGDANATATLNLTYQ